ncbi:nucleotide exchange factor GrpE [Mastigocladopsis repens]|uniref:nucleotide exchange factor GrpE n=1 Tax=Mastigocladopsis repens TaxID=221287 RepID=UPI0002FB2549|nr:nucleotide exchange factor GrpE [Mastigocladopsis repens]
MNSKKNNNKNFQNLDEPLRQSINEALHKFLDENLKKHIENSLEETMNKYIEEQKKLQRAYYTNTNAILDNSSAIKELYDKLEQTLGELDDFRNSVEKMLMEQRQKNGELQRKIHHWEQATTEFFRLLERAVDYETDENRRLINRILDGFAHTVMDLGMERIIPQADESLNESFHEAVDEEESDIIPGNIVRCVSWGYRIGDKLLEKAKVVVAKSPAQATKVDANLTLPANE